MLRGAYLYTVVGVPSSRRMVVLRIRPSISRVLSQPGSNGLTLLGGRCPYIFPRVAMPDLSGRGKRLHAAKKLEKVGKVYSRQ